MSSGYLLGGGGGGRGVSSRFPDLEKKTPIKIQNMTNVSKSKHSRHYKVFSYLCCLDCGVLFNIGTYGGLRFPGLKYISVINCIILRCYF